MRVLPLLAAVSLWAPSLATAPASAEGPRADIPLGAAINYERLRQDALELRTYSDNFNAFTPENVMKMESLQPQQGVFDFSKSDARVAFGASRSPTNGRTLRTVPQADSAVANTRTGMRR